MLNLVHDGTQLLYRGDHLLGECCEECGGGVCCAFSLPPQCYVDLKSLYPLSTWRKFKVSPRCLRVLIYCSVTHNGFTYSGLGTPDYVLAIGQPGLPVIEMDGPPIAWAGCVSYGGVTDLHGDYSCTPDGRDLYEALEAQDESCMPDVGVPHTVHVVMDFFWFRVGHKTIGGLGQKGPAHALATAVVFREVKC